MILLWQHLTHPQRCFTVLKLAFLPGVKYIACSQNSLLLCTRLKHSHRPFMFSNRTAIIPTSPERDCDTGSPLRGMVLCSASYSSFPTDSMGKVPYLPLLGLGAVFFIVVYLLGRRKKEDGSKVSNSVKNQLLLAERMIQKNNYLKAEKACHKALGLLMDSEHAEKKAYLEARAVTMDKLANIYFAQMKLTEAEMMFKETLFIMLNVGTPQDDDAVIEISLKLAKIYNNQRRYEEAETGLEWCVDTARKKLDMEKSHQRYGMLGLCLQGRAQYHQMHKNYDRAIRDFNETVDVAEAMQNRLQVAVAYSNLATAVDGARDYKKAVGLVSKSLDIVEQLRLQQKDPQSSHSSETGSGDKQSSESPRQYTEAELDYYSAVFRINLGTIHSNNGHRDLALAAYELAEPLAKNHGDQQLLNKIHYGQIESNKTL